MIKPSLPPSLALPFVGVVVGHPVIKVTHIRRCVSTIRNNCYLPLSIAFWYLQVVLLKVPLVMILLVVVVVLVMVCDGNLSVVIDADGSSHFFLHWNRVVQTVHAP